MSSIVDWCRDLAGFEAKRKASSPATVVTRAAFYSLLPAPLLLLFSSSLLLAAAAAAPRCRCLSRLALPALSRSFERKRPTPRSSSSSSGSTLLSLSNRSLSGDRSCSSMAGRLLGRAATPTSGCEHLYMLPSSLMAPAPLLAHKPSLSYLPSNLSARCDVAFSARAPRRNEHKRARISSLSCRIVSCRCL